MQAHLYSQTTSITSWQTFKNFLTKNSATIIIADSLVAEVAELVDALGSGSSGSIPVGVRVSPSAPERQFQAHLQGDALFLFLAGCV